jgi:dolichyl-phosphate beta-glucosyltransferase
MAASPYLSLIAPAYNEAQRIQATLTEFQAYPDRAGHGYEIIVAADGEDGTRELLASMAARDRRLSVLGSAERGGKGRGIRQGVARARGQIIGFADADNKTPITELDKLLPWLNQRFDLVIGSRTMAESRIEVPLPLHRRLGDRATGNGLLSFPLQVTGHGFSNRPPGIAQLPGGLLAGVPAIFTH